MATEAAGCGKTEADVKAIMMLNRSGCTEQDKVTILNQCRGLESHRLYDKLRKQLIIVVGKGSSEAGDEARVEKEERNEEVFVVGKEA